jgi:zinc transporter ZupT
MYNTIIIFIAEWFEGLTAVWQVAIYAMLTALATGLGAIPFFFVKTITRQWKGIGDAFAAGLMLTASFRLIEEGLEYNLWRLLVGIVVGMALITWSHSRFNQKDHFEIGDLQGASALKALMIVGVMTIHSFAEGVGVGVSFGGGTEFGTYISAAIAIHNIPEGLAICMVLVPRGISVWKSMLWSVFSSLPQPVLAVPSFLFVDAFKPFLPFGLGFAAGAMIWMVVSELIPEALEHVKKQKIAISVVAGVVIMVLLQEVI